MLKVTRNFGGLSLERLVFPSGFEENGPRFDRTVRKVPEFYVELLPEDFDLDTYEGKRFHDAWQYVGQLLRWLTDNISDSRALEMDKDERARSVWHMALDLWHNCSHIDSLPAKVLLVQPLLTAAESLEAVFEDDLDGFQLSDDVAFIADWARPVVSVLDLKGVGQ